MLTPPAAPRVSNSIANPDQDEVYTVSWPPVVNATSYELQEQHNGGTWNTVYTGSDTMRSLAGKANGAWCYQILASNAAGSSNWSNIQCTSVNTTAAPSYAFLPLVGAPQLVAAGPQPIDALFAAVGRQAPGFGGMYVDEDNDILYIYMRDGSPDTAAAALRNMFGQENLPDNVQMLQANFSFLQLKQWHNLMDSYLFAIPGVVYTDVDDAINLLSIGVETQQARDQVMNKLAELGIPTEAVRTEEIAPIGLQVAKLATEPTMGIAQIRATTSLRGFHRPLVGGLQIASLQRQMN